MATIVKRKQGETGNPLEGWLENKAGTLTIPDGAVVTLNAWDDATGAQVIVDAVVILVDRATRFVHYDWADGDLSLARTLELEFTITPDGGDPTFVPDTDDDELYLVVAPRHGAAA